MTVHFHTPPAAQRTGGLDAAINALQAALRERGVGVDNSPPALSRGEELVHFHGLWQPAHARLSSQCRKDGLPYVVSPHGMLEPWAWRHKRWKKWPYFHLVEKRHLRGASALLATSEMEAQRLRRILPGVRVETLPLGATGEAMPDYGPAREQLGWRPEERVLLFLSRVHAKKGLDLLLHALAERGAPPNCRLVIVGGGEARYVAELQTHASKHAARLPRVDWIGEVWGEERWRYFQGSDLFCLPTHSENFGLAVLEACQVGTPVLTTHATPWAEWLSDGRGEICDPTIRSVKEALERAFAKAPPTNQERTALATWAREKFSWPTLAPYYVAVYQSVLQPVRSRL